MIHQQKKTGINELQTELQRKIQLYQHCYELTQQIAKMVEEDNEDVVLRLLKRRDVIFHQIREVDEHIGAREDIANLRTFSQQSPEIDVLWGQIQVFIQKIIAADGELFQQMTAKRTETLNALTRSHRRHRLAIAYQIAGADQARFINTDQ